MNLENEEDATEDIVTDHVKGEKSEYSSSQQGEPNRGQVPALQIGNHDTAEICSLSTVALASQVSLEKK